MFRFNSRLIDGRLAVRRITSFCDPQHLSADKCCAAMLDGIKIPPHFHATAFSVLITRFYRAAEESSFAPGSPWYWLMCSSSFKWSYQVNFRIKDVTATTAKAQAAKRKFQVTM